MANNLNIDDGELEFIQTNIDNATSTEPIVHLQSHLIRLFSQDPNITTLIINADAVLPLEYLTLAYETYYDFIEHNDEIDTEDMDENEILRINFYRQINELGQHGGLLADESEGVLSRIGKQISSCLNLMHIIIDGNGTWMSDDDLHYFFEELRPPNTVTLTFRNCRFDSDNSTALISILGLSQVSNLIMSDCFFAKYGADILIENEGNLNQYTNITMSHCTFHRTNGHNSEDINLANYIAGSEGIQELRFNQCNLLPIAVMILNNITVDGNIIAQIQN
jgi:hypothetical protein